MIFAVTRSIPCFYPVAAPAPLPPTRTPSAALRSGLDGARFLALVERHLVGPLVWHNLRQHPAGTFEPELMAALAAGYRDNAFSELAVTGETVKLHRLLSESDIPHCVLKGLPVGQRYYGDAGLRQAGDIDLLVPPAMLDEACRLLSAAGYRISHPIDHFKPRQRRYFLFTDNQLELEAPGSGSVIELHWRPLQLPSTLAGLDLSAQTNRWDVADCRIPFLDDEETLLHLCAHGAKHAWYRMKWVFDLPNVLESREWDWPALRAKARRVSLRTRVAAGAGDCGAVVELGSSAGRAALAG